MLKEFLRRIAFVGILFVVIFGVVAYKDVLVAFSEPVDIVEDYPETEEEIKSIKAVKTELDMVLGVFAEEETTTTNKYGAVTNRRYDYYYVVPVFTETETYYVGVKVSSTKSVEYDKVCEATWAYLYGETEELKTVEFEGGFYKMEDEAFKYFKEWFEDNEWLDEKDIKKYVLPLMLEPIKLSTTRKLTFVFVGVLALCIFLLVLSFRKGKEKTQSVTPQKAVITINDINYPTSNFEKVNKLIEKGKKDKAVKELMEVTGISETAANAVILDWYAYWC